ncbi:MAG: hypothetical protein ACI4CS_11220 [Candidatus Weimeria sp.]
MRITSNMILHNAASNINYNKTLVDKGENQMTTKTKIQRPSDDPVIAVRSLALQTRLSKINQYYETNIPDAEHWMDVSETALNNIIDNITELKKLCVQGSTSTMSTSDRATVLQQLKSLQESIFSEGNADYAGRTVFTGYRTDKTLVFTDSDCDKDYNITQNLSANDFEKVSYFNNEVTVPANETQINNLDDTNTSKTNLTKNDITIQSSSYKRLRLAYDDISDVESLTFSYKDAKGNTVSNTMQLVNQDTDRVPPLAEADKNGNLEYGSGIKSADQTREVKTTDGTTSEVTYNYYTVGVTSSQSTVTNNDGSTTTTETITKTGASDGSVTKTVRTTTTPANGGKATTTATTTKTQADGTVITTVTDASGDKTTKAVDKNNQELKGTWEHLDDADSGSDPKTVYVFENELDWADWSSKNGATDADKLTKYVPDDAAVLIKETGDLIFGKNASDQMSAKGTSVAVNYDKDSFSAGELKPEYYYDCVDNTGVNYKDLEGTVGSRLVYNRSDIAYDINYTVAENQTITVNLQANEIFDSSAQQDIKDLTSVITNTQDAYEKREKIAAMMSDSDYQDSATQAKLQEWYTAASKEYDYYNNYMQETFERVLGNTDTYLNKANLADTTLGCRGDELSITKTRMDEQQESVTELKSNNDNLDLSTIMMNYTAYYTAYQASLVAAGKLGEQSLLNYI